MNNKEKVADLSSLYKSYKKVVRGKRDRRAAIDFSLDPLGNLCRLKESLLDGTYEMGKYTRFPVLRPVRRDVCACAFEDKIVLRSLCKNVLWDAVEPHLITDNYASRVGTVLMWHLINLNKTCVDIISTTELLATYLKWT